MNELSILQHQRDLMDARIIARLQISSLLALGAIEAHDLDRLRTLLKEREQLDDAVTRVLQQRVAG